jgi:DNA-binding transcriptional MerR regulator
MSEFTIAELAEQSGVNRRNIHFYVQQGLLPPAQGAGLAARYSDEHLARLNAIRALRDRGLRLDQIRQQLEKLSFAEVQALLTQQPQAEPVAVPQAELVRQYTLAAGLTIQVGPQAAANFAGSEAEFIAAVQQLVQQFARKGVIR